MRLASKALTAVMLSISVPGVAQQTPGDAGELDAAARQAQIELRQTFTNLQFEDFGPSPVTGPIYQASAGGRMIYFAPESGHLLFAAVYDRNGINVTALAQESLARKQLASIDRSQALAIGPEGAPEVIEFTDPDCPYCQALERFWQAKAAEGYEVRRLIFFVSNIHPEAAAKAEHILCSQSPEAAFEAVYGGRQPPDLGTCDTGRRTVEAHARTAQSIGVTGTPTLFVDGQAIAGFKQAEIEEFLVRSRNQSNGR